MEVSAGQKLKKQQQLALASITELYPSSSSCLASPVVARYSADNGVVELRFLSESDATDFIDVDLSTAQLFKLGPDRSVCIYEDLASDTSKEKFRNEEESRAFHCAFEQWKKEIIVQGITLPNGAVTAHKSKFDNKIEASSAKMYFHYYGQLLHQQNMLQDYAGAKHVYAVEASEMAEYAHKLIAGNPSLGERITVIKGKVEEVELPEKADILISEPMGTLLVNERMLESYVIARDQFLLPSGKMFPTVGR
ncbi:hypothetical protein P3X46_027828 [Hevea brasiliensis]|uniref:type I protein arginine methyltransferase n=1 Tax=Hevea brasiliensis TaxID=3981 RepID=A0ABQ9L266_HEVBR|nr:hypothetical protein P3X46_027828 [Hevea brasiliensis]